MAGCSCLGVEEKKDEDEKLGRFTESNALVILLRALSPIDVARRCRVELRNTPVRAGLRSFKVSTMKSRGPGCHGLGSRARAVCLRCGGLDSSETEPSLCRGSVGSPACSLSMAAALLSAARTRGEVSLVATGLMAGWMNDCASSLSPYRASCSSVPSASDGGEGVSSGIMVSSLSGRAAGCGDGTEAGSVHDEAATCEAAILWCLFETVYRLALDPDRLCGYQSS